MKEELVKWLLEFDEPSLTYRVLTELLDKPVNNRKVTAAKTAILESDTVKGIFEKMHPDGYWLQKNYKGQLLGNDRYYCTQTTHFVLGYLAELGLDRSDERILESGQPDGLWQSPKDAACLWGYLDSRLDELERLSLDFTPTQATWKVGSRDKPNPWLTLYAQLAKKYKEQ